MERILRDMLKAVYVKETFKMQQKVTIYSKADCMQCNFTKKWLLDEGLEYVEIRADLDDKALAYVKDE